MQMNLSQSVRAYQRDQTVTFLILNKSKQGQGSITEYQETEVDVRWKTKGND